MPRKILRSESEYADVIIQEQSRLGIRSVADVAGGYDAGVAAAAESVQDSYERMKAERAEAWVERALGDAWQEAQRIIANLEESYALAEKYRYDPVGFCRDVLKEKTTRDTERVMESVLANPVTIARSANGPGKSQPVKSLVATPNGWRCIGDLEVGDEVFTRSGRATRVVGVYPQGEQPTYEVSFSDQTHTLASRDHLWLIRSSSQKNKGLAWRTVTTFDLCELLHQHIHIPLCEPVEYEAKELPIDPYVLGAILGDGGTRTGLVVFTNADQEVIDRVGRSLPEGVELRKAAGKYQFHISRGNIGGLPNPVKDALLRMALIGVKSPEKFIPPNYLHASTDQRLDLLRGLMDTDGYVAKDGYTVFTTTSLLLVNDVKELVQSLGGTGVINTKIPTYRGRDGAKLHGKLAYNLSIKLPLNPFYLSRKADRYIADEKRQRPTYRLVQGLRYIGEMESVCIKVEDDSQLYLTNDYLVTHNSFTAASLAIWYYKVNIESKVYLTAAQPFENLKRILWGEVWSKVKRNRELFRYDIIRNLYIGRSEEEASDEGTNSFIVGWSIPSGGSSQDREAKFSGKHAPQLLFVVDEGDAVPDEVYKGIEGCSSGGMYRLLIMFNPKIRTGMVYHKEVNRQAHVVHLSAFTHPNVVEGETVIPGAVDRETTVRRINEWTVPLAIGEEPNESCFDLPEFLVGETAQAMDGTMYQPLGEGKRKIVDPTFSYMVMGEYPTQGAQQLISEDWIARARSRHDLYVSRHGTRPPEGVQPVMGVDVAEYGVDANVACFRYGGYIEFEKWSGVDVDETGMRSTELAIKRNVAMVYVDATGVGTSVAPNMVRRGRDREVDIRAVGVKSASSPSKAHKVEQGEFMSLGDQLWWLMREWLRVDDTAMLPSDPQLLDELRAPSYEKLKNGKIQITPKDQLRKLLHRSPDKADALRLTFTPIARARIVPLLGQAHSGQEG